MGVKPKKHLGQHFLTNLGIAQSIANAINAKEIDSVVEIGPGMGVLTQFLLEKPYNLTVVELDQESVKYLKIRFLHNKSLNVIAGDFLQLNLQKVVTNSFALVGNFPYNISSQIVFKLLEHKNQIPQMVGMFQKEVAERIVAPHGSKTYGILSVLVQVYYEVEYLFTVEAEEFNPPPKVKSAVIRLTRKNNPTQINESLLKSVVKSAFNQRRKKLKNALSKMIQTVDIDEDILNRRAEQISVSEFVALVNKLDKRVQ